MSARATRRLAWGLFGLYAALASTTLALVIFGSASHDDVTTVLTVGFAFVGALVAARQPANRVGWLLLCIAMSWVLDTALDAYLRTPGVPGVTAVAWMSAWIWYLWLGGAVCLLPLLFPDGRPFSPRWRAVLWFDMSIVVLNITCVALADGPLPIDWDRSSIENPTGVGGTGATVIRWLSGAAGVLLTLCLVLSAVGLAQRLRQARGRERQQLRWFAYVGVLALGFLGLAAIDAMAGDSPAWLSAVGAVGWVTHWLLVLLGLPLAMGIAMLRHRLYDVDVVIRRTLVYGSLTATLAAAYVGFVLLLELVLRPVTGASDLAVAVSTLAVAALFRPARSRIQVLVDRRFYRHRYDAAHTLDAFAARLRHQVDLDAVGADLGEVVQQTVKPAHLSLWLREVPR